MPDIRLTVPFAYEARLVRPRKRTESRVIFLADVDVSLRAPTSAEAPVAFRCELPATRFEGLQEHRWFEGALWRPYHTSEWSGEPETHRDLGWLEGRLGEARHHGLLGTRTDARSWGAPAPLRMEDDPELGRVVHDGRAAAEAGLRAQADDVIAVDGLLWRRTPEPVLVAHWQRGAAHLESVAASAVTHDTFRLDQADRFRGMRPGLRIDQFYALPEVIMPEVLRTRVTEGVLLLSMEELTCQMGEQVRHGGHAYFAAYAALRDASASLAADLGDDAVADVPAACAALGEALEVERTRLGDGSCQVLGLRVAEAFARVALDGLDHDDVHTMRI